RCHGEDHSSQPAPSLDRLAGNMSRVWLVDWLTAAEHPGTGPASGTNPGEPASPRRMPALGLSPAQAEAVADWLLAPRPANDAPPAPANDAKPSSAEKRPRRPKTAPQAPTGDQLFLSLGCLACHSWRDLGASGWLGGGDLTRVADKRPADFFAAWLADPA